MAAPTRTPRREWIAAGLRALAAGGPDAVRVDALAKSLGVTRGGFYWHFEDRAALLAEMLGAWERMGVEDVIARIEADGPADARTRLRRLFAEAAEGGELLAIDLAVRDWARRDAAVAGRLRAADNRRMGYLREQFATFCPDPDEAEARALLAASLWIGTHFIASEHAGRSRRAVVERAFAGLLTPPPGAPPG